MAPAEHIANDGPFRSCTWQIRGEECRRTQRDPLQCATNEHVARRVRGCLYEFAFDAELCAERQQRRGAAKTLRANFEQVSVTPLGMNRTTWAATRFDNPRVHSLFAH